MTTPRDSLPRSLAIFLLAFLSFLVLGTLSAAWLGEFPTMSLLSITAILTLFIGGTTGRLPGPALIGIACAWPCAMLLSLMNFGDLGPSLRPIAVAETSGATARATARVLELPTRRVRGDLSASTSRTSVYYDSVTRTRKTMTGRFTVAPLVDPSWTPGEPVDLWVGCSNLTDVYDECHDIWSADRLLFLHADAYLRSDFAEAVQIAELQPGVQGTEGATVLRALDAQGVADLRRLPRISLAVLAVGLLGGAIWTVRSR